MNGGSSPASANVRSIAATTMRAYGDWVEPRILRRAGRHARSGRSGLEPAQSAAARTRCGRRSARGSAPRRRDRPETERHRVVPAAGDEMHLRALVSRPRSPPRRDHAPPRARRRLRARRASARARRRRDERPGADRAGREIPATSSRASDSSSAQRCRPVRPRRRCRTSAAGAPRARRCRPRPPARARGRARRRFGHARSRLTRSGRRSRAAPAASRSPRRRARRARAGARRRAVRRPANRVWAPPRRRSSEHAVSTRSRRAVSGRASR